MRVCRKRKKTSKPSTSSSISRLNNFQHTPAVFVAVVVLHLLFPILLRAAPWEFSQRLSANPITDQMVPKDIGAQRDLTQLLKNISYALPLLQLEARFDGRVWIIDGELGEVIKDIRIKFSQLELQDPLSLLINKYIGRTNSETVREKIRESIVGYLDKRGYTRSKVNVERSTEVGGLVYMVYVDQGPACHIRDVIIPFDIPQDVPMEIRKGKPCDLEQINELFDGMKERLTRSGYYFHDIAIESMQHSDDRSHIDIKISGQLGKKVHYRLSDENQLFLDLFFSAGSFEFGGIEAYSPENIKSEISKHYRDNGYDDVIVKDPEIRELGPNETEYYFEIQKGEQYAINEFHFNGNNQFSQKELTEAMGISFWSPSLLLNRTALAQKIEKIESIYENAGYWDVQTDAPLIKKDARAGIASFELRISEGRRYVLNSISFFGNKELSSDELLEMSNFVIGSPISKNAVLSFDDTIKSAYLRRGYIYSKVKTALKRTEKRDFVLTDLDIEIAEGSRFKIGAIAIVGLVRTDPAVVKRELAFATGEWYNPDKINDSKRNLVTLGIFKSVQVVPLNRFSSFDKEGILDLNIELQEGDAGTVSFGPGWERTRGIHYTGEIAHKNLGGTGRKVSFRASFSEERHQKSINDESDRDGKTLLGRKVGGGYIEPFLFDMPLSGKISASHQATAEASIWQISNLLETSVSHQLRVIIPETTVTGFYRLRLNRDEGSSKQKDSLVATGGSKVGSIGIQYLLDRRDNIAWPTNGYLFRTELEWARYDLLGEFRYFKWDVGTSGYYDIWHGLIIALGISLTSYDAIERKNRDSVGVLPSSQRLKAGGSNQVRGFSRELGPYVSGLKGGTRTEEDPSGGTKRTILKAELRYAFAEKFGSALFVDSGNTFFSEEEKGKFTDTFDRQYRACEDSPKDDEPCQQLSIEDNLPYEFRDLVRNPNYVYSKHYLGFGLAFSYLTPLGPLRLAIARPWREPESENCGSQRICFPRSPTGDAWYKKFQVDMSIGTEF